SQGGDAKPRVFLLPAALRLADERQPGYRTVSNERCMMPRAFDLYGMDLLSAQSVRLLLTPLAARPISRIDAEAPPRTTDELHTADLRHRRGTREPVPAQQIPCC